MKLLLTSAGITNKSIENTLKDLVGEEIKTAFIPTAANIEEGDKDWLVDNFNQFKRLGYIDIIDIVSLSKEEVLNRLKEANVIVFGGGNTPYLMKQVIKSGLFNELPKLLKTKVYVGISAGSIILSKKLWSSSEFLFGDENGDSPKGLSYVDFNFRPHYNSKYFPKVRKKILQEIAKKNPNEKIYACDDNTAIKIIDNKIKVISEGKWDVFPE